MAIKERASGMPPCLLILGDVAEEEMQPVIQQAMSVFAGSEIRILPRVSRFTSIEEDEIWMPDLVVVCQTEPDEFTKDEVLALITRYPLARLVCCFGQWCEADGRTRAIWPQSIRVPARMAAMRLRREREVIAGKQSALPLTAGREEAFEFDAATISYSGVADQIATVISPDRQLRLSFEERLRTLGFHVDQIDSVPDVILFDADPWNDITAVALRELSDAQPQAAIIALMNFARPEDRHAVTRCGADDVLAKLVNQEQLAAVVTRLSNRGAAGTAPCGALGRDSL